jgi:hypothetical protein
METDSGCLLRGSASCTDHGQQVSIKPLFKDSMKYGQPECLDTG